MFIIILAIGSGVYWVWVPETKAVPLEELAVIFGDVDEVKVYSADIHLDENQDVVYDDHHGGAEPVGKDAPRVHMQEKA